MDAVINGSVQFVHLLNQLVAESGTLVNSLAAVVSTLTQIAGLISQAVDFLGSLVNNVTPPM